MKNRLAVFPIAALLAVACTNVHQTELCVGTRYGKVVEELKSDLVMFADDRKGGPKSLN